MSFLNCLSFTLGLDCTLFWFLVIDDSFIYTQNIVWVYCLLYNNILWFLKDYILVVEVGHIQVGLDHKLMKKLLDQFCFFWHQERGRQGHITWHYVGNFLLLTNRRNNMHVWRRNFIDLLVWLCYISIFNNHLILVCC